jgi:hypothetical protein
VNRHAIDVTSLHERASATPDPRAAAAARANRRPAAAADDVHLEADRTLRGTQLWFEQAVTSPDGVPGGDREVGLRLTSGPSLTAAERLAIYRDGYRARLVECLADDYPILRHALGPGAFEELCSAYVDRHPSRSPSLNAFGRSMEAFVRGEGEAEARSELAVPRAFAGDLAALEWSIVEVIHAPASEPLTLENLQGVPADAWAGARLVANTAIVLRRFEYPVNAYFQQVRDGQQPPIPAAAPSATVVYRSGPSVWRMDLTPPMFAVLSALVAAEPLATALGRAEEHMAGEDPAAVGDRVSHWFREWIASGLFVRVEV